MWRCVTLKANEALRVLPADKGNAAVVLGTPEYNKKIAAVPEEMAYRNLKKDPFQDLHSATSQKTTFFIVTAVKTSNRTIIDFLDKMMDNVQKVNNYTCISERCQKGMSSSFWVLICSPFVIIYLSHSILYNVCSCKNVIKALRITLNQN
jgi:hypothetical protein